MLAEDFCFRLRTNLSNICDKMERYLALEAMEHEVDFET